MAYDMKSGLAEFVSRNRDDLYEQDNNFAYHWYKYGEEHKDQFFVNFMVEWMAFNWLYSDIHEKSERKRIEIYYRNQGVLFDAFSLPQVDIFLRMPIKDMSSHDEEQYQETRKMNEKYFRIINAKINSFTEGKRITQEDKEAALLQTLYAVRCNLFHGSKCLYDSRDIELVKAAGVVLHKYLETLLKVGKLSRPF